MSGLDGRGAGAGVGSSRSFLASGRWLGAVGEAGVVGMQVCKAQPCGSERGRGFERGLSSTGKMCGEELSGDAFACCGCGETLRDEILGPGSGSAICAEC